MRVYELLDLLAPSDYNKKLILVDGLGVLFENTLGNCPKSHIPNYKVRLFKCGQTYLKFLVDSGREDQKKC